MNSRVNCPLLLAVWALMGLKTVAAVRAEFAFEHAPANRSAPQSLPNVVRITVQDADAVSRGSGTLIGVHDGHGFVLTNWHVVRDAAGQILVEFPDGFRSAASVVKTDAQWDLALLLIWRPHAEPLPLATAVPQPGEWLTIAGYGQGEFRAARGVCTDYVAPSPEAPFEMVEIATRARYGDSGGPMINQRGELAAVLFGSGDGRTTGSHVARVRQFLDSARAAQGAEPVAQASLAAGPSASLAPPPFVPPTADGPPVESRTLLAETEPAEASLGAEPWAISHRQEMPEPLVAESDASSADVAGGRSTSEVAARAAASPSATGEWAATFEGPPPPAECATGATRNEGIWLLEQVKSILAIIGLISLVLLLLPK